MDLFKIIRDTFVGLVLSILVLIVLVSMVLTPFVWIVILVGGKVGFDNPILTILFFIGNLCGLIFSYIIGTDLMKQEEVK